MTFFLLSENTGNEVFSIKAKEFAEDLGDAFEVGKKSDDNSVRFGTAPRITNARNHVIACYCRLQMQVSH